MSQKSVRVNRANPFQSEMQTVRSQTDPQFNDFFLIDVEIGSANFKKPLKIRMTDGWRHTRAAGETTELAVLNLIAQSANGNGKKFKRNGKGKNSPYRAETDMSLHVKGNCYLIFRLSAFAGLRFSTDHFAFSFDSELPKESYQFVRRVMENGDLSDDTQDATTGTWSADCRMIIVACDHEKIPTQTVALPPPAGPELHGASSFNLHLDVLHDAADQNGAYIPIIVDPDVRFPGGNEGP